MKREISKKDLDLVSYGVLCGIIGGIIGNIFITSMYRLVDNDLSWTNMAVFVLCSLFVIRLIWLVHRSEYSNKIEK